MDLVERELAKQTEEALVKGLPYIQVARSFNRVVEACFGSELQPIWRDTVSNFTDKYRETDITVTPKVYFIIQMKGKLFFSVKGAHGYASYW